MNWLGYSGSRLLLLHPLNAFYRSKRKVKALLVSYGDFIFGNKRAVAPSNPSESIYPFRGGFIFLCFISIVRRFGIFQHCMRVHAKKAPAWAGASLTKPLINAKRMRDMNGPPYLSGKKFLAVWKWSDTSFDDAMLWVLLENLSAFFDILYAPLFWIFHPSPARTRQAVRNKKGLFCIPWWKDFEERKEESYAGKRSTVNWKV